MKTNREIKKNSVRRSLSGFLAGLMLFGCLPLQAFADEYDTAAQDKPAYTEQAQPKETPATTETEKETPAPNDIKPADSDTEKGESEASKEGSDEKQEPVNEAPSEQENEAEPEKSNDTADKPDTENDPKPAESDKEDEKTNPENGETEEDKSEKEDDADPDKKDEDEKPEIQNVITSIRGSVAYSDEGEWQNLLRPLTYDFAIKIQATFVSPEDEGETGEETEPQTSDVFEAMLEPNTEQFR